MHKRHTTAGNPTTYLHIAMIAAIALAVSFAVPFAGQNIANILVPRAADLGVLFSMTVGFLMYKSLLRRSDIENYIAVELNKIRRIYHLARHIAKTDPEIRPWFDEVRRDVFAYLGMFKNISFHEYEAGNPAFRNLTYTLYSLPSLHKPYNSELYQALMQSSGEVTEAREFIRAKKDDTVSLFSWIVVLVISIVFSVSILAAMPYAYELRLPGAAAIFCLYLVLQLIYEHDRFNISRDRVRAKQYTDNLASLEYAERMR